MKTKDWILLGFLFFSLLYIGRLASKSDVKLSEKFDRCYEQFVQEGIPRYAYDGFMRDCFSR